MNAKPGSGAPVGAETNWEPKTSDSSLLREDATTRRSLPAINFKAILRHKGLVT